MRENDIAADRAERIETMRAPDLARIRGELERALGDKELDDSARWVSLALSLDYAHPGQDAATYMCHPLRVGRMYVDHAHKPHDEGVGLAVLHNILEVSTAPREELAATLGEPMLRNIAILTVDRARQWDRAYKDAYYAAIADAPAHVGEVKVLDKLDNLYLLCLNPDEQVRALYLDEIERWVVPLAERRLPELAGLIGALVEDNRRVGHRPARDWEVAAL